MNYMDEAIKTAYKAEKYRDIPIGAVIVENGRIISKGYNCKEKNKDVTAHAEIVAIRKACKKKKTNYLNECILYVTLEPCKMCMGAIEQSHISKVVYCLKSPKYGNLLDTNLVNKEQIYNENYEKYLVAFFKNNLR